MLLESGDRSSPSAKAPRIPQSSTSHKVYHQENHERFTPISRPLLRAEDRAHLCRRRRRLRHPHHAPQKPWLLRSIPGTSLFLSSLSSMATFSPHIYKKDRIRIFGSHYLPLDTARTTLQATNYFGESKLLHSYYCIVLTVSRNMPPQNSYSHFRPFLGHEASKPHSGGCMLLTRIIALNWSRLVDHFNCHVALR